ncbi:1006_t:CDS:2, partial [Dentiscutata erythropus]
MPDPVWIHFIQLGYVVGFKQKRREFTSEQKKNYFRDLYEENNSNIFINILNTSSPVVSTSGSALVAPTDTSLAISTSSTSNKK